MGGANGGDGRFDGIYLQNIKICKSVCGTRSDYNNTDHRILGAGRLGSSMICFIFNQLKRGGGRGNSQKFFEGRKKLGNFVHLVAAFVGFLNGVELLVGLTDDWLDEIVWGFSCSVQHQLELLKGSGMSSRSLESGDKSPFSCWILSPCVCCHEWPVGESIL